MGARPADTPEADAVQVPDEIVARLPKALRDHVRRGGAVRWRESDEMPGRCGAIKLSKGGGYCARLAGHGTKHKGFGRCSTHPDADGLPPWVGPLTPEQKVAINGGNLPDPETGQLQRRHGVSEIAQGQRSAFEIISGHLSTEQREMFHAALVEPGDRVDFELRLLSVIQMDIVAEMRRRVLSTPRGKEPEVASLRAALTNLSTVSARWLEVKARFAENESANRSRTALVDLLRGLSNEDLARLHDDPSRMHELMNAGS